MSGRELAQQIVSRLHQGQSYGHLSMIDHVHIVARAAYQIGYALGYEQIELQDIVVVGLLHDSVEDVLLNKDCSEILYERLFGEKVAKSIIILTRQLPYHIYLNKICDVKLRNPSEYAAIVKLADSIVNLEMSRLSKDIHRIKKYEQNVGLLSVAIGKALGKDEDYMGDLVELVIQNQCWALIPEEEV